MRMRWCSVWCLLHRLAEQVLLVRAFICYPEYAFDWCENSTSASCIHNYAFSVSHFQRKIWDYYELDRRPPLAEAFFLTKLPKPFQQEFMDGGCGAPLIMAYLLVATAKLLVDDDASRYAQIAMGLAQTLPDPMQEMLQESSTWPFQEAITKFEKTLHHGQVVVPLQHGSSDLTTPLVEIVIAHCRETLDWVEHDLLPVAPPGCALTLYEKCGEQPTFSDMVLKHFAKVSIVPCPDPVGLPRGDECLAYLTHIDSRYLDLAPFTVFLQADPDQHLHFTYLRTVLAMIVRGMYGVPFMNINGARHVRTKTPCLGAVYEAIFKEPLLKPLGPYCCAQFVVQDSRIRARPLSFYQNMLRLVDGSMGGGDLCSARPVTRSTHCYGMEYMWHLVFGDEHEPPLRQDDVRLPLPLRQKFGNEFTKRNWNDMVLAPNTAKKIVESVDYEQMAAAGKLN